MNVWRPINRGRPDRHWPKVGAVVLVTRDWKRFPREVAIAEVVKHGRRRWLVSHPAPKDGLGYPFTNAIAWTEVPEAYRGEEAPGDLKAKP